jgi:hypothetical protein
MRGIALEAGIAREHLHDLALGRYPLGAKSRAGLSDVFKRVRE